MLGQGGGAAVGKRGGEGDAVRGARSRSRVSLEAVSLHASAHSRDPRRAHGEACVRATPLSKSRAADRRESPKHRAHWPQEPRSLPGVTPEYPPFCLPGAVREPRWARSRSGVSREAVSAHASMLARDPRRARSERCPRGEALVKERSDRRAPRSSILAQLGGVACPPARDPRHPVIGD